MRISDLAQRADVSIPTVKFYLRQGLIPAGTATSMTMAEYTSAHVERVRLVRAMVDVGGLSLATVRQVLARLDAETAAESELPEAAGKAADLALRSIQESLPPKPPQFRSTIRATAAISALGWQVDSGSQALNQLEAALIALDTVGLPPNLSTLLTYADAAMRAARADVEAMPAGSPDQVIRHVVLQSVMYEPLLTALHRLAQQHTFAGNQLGASSS